MIDKELHGRIIGARGERIRKIEGDTGTRIVMPKSGDSNEIVLYANSIEAIDRAAESIHRFAKNEGVRTNKRIDLQILIASYSLGSLFQTG